MTKNHRAAAFGSLLLSLVAGSLLVGCATPYSEAPIATNFPTTKQQKLQAGSHWNAVAADAATSLANALKLGKGCIAPVPECNTIFVRDVKVPTEFATAFRTQFITSLVNRGVNVAKSSTGAIEVDFDLQPLKFTGQRPDGKFTSAAAIYGGLWVLHGAWQEVSEGGSVGLALGAFDAYRWHTSEFSAGPTPENEVIVTVSASTADRYLGRVTNVYYFSATDESLYQPKAALTAIPVKGDGK